VIEMELRRLRREEEERGCNGRGVMRDEKLWAYMPEGLLRRHNIRRSLASCKYYWGRFGREKSGFDERIKKDPNNLSTSVQNRRRQLKSVKNSCIDLKSTHLLYHCDVKWDFPFEAQASSSVADDDEYLCLFYYVAGLARFSLIFFV
jgi:hypothetical protein